MDRWCLHRPTAVLTLCGLGGAGCFRQVLRATDLQEQYMQAEDICTTSNIASLVGTSSRCVCAVMHVKQCREHLCYVYVYIK